MQKANIPSEPKVYLALALLLLILLILIPRTGKFKYEYKKGLPWAYETLEADFDFPILKTKEQMLSERTAAESRTVPYYKHSETISQSDIKAAEALNLGDYTEFKPLVISSLMSILNRGVLNDDDAVLGDADAVIYIQKDKRAVKYAVSDLYTVSTAREKLLADAIETYQGLSLDSLFTASGVYDIISSNLIYDEETTRLVHDEGSDNISPTLGFMTSGQVIVSKGEMVTAEICQMIDSYKAEYESSMGYSGPPIRLWLGNGLIVLVVVLIFFFSIIYTNPGVFAEYNRFIYLLFIFALASFLALAVDKWNSDFLFMSPFTLVALYLLAFFKKRVVLPVYMTALLPLLIFCHNGVTLYVMYSVAGIVTIFVFDYFNRGWKQFVTALTVFMTLVLTYQGFVFLNDAGWYMGLGKLVALFISAFLSVAGYPLIYLFEKMFGLVSQSRLQELCDTNDNEALMELAHKAPGTFQHSLQVMNLCDAAASSIDANVLLAKVGALYHDIGKMNNPQCFVENELMGGNYHKNLSSKESAREIIRHVTDGLILAEKYRLPGEVRAFIETHHGTSSTGYFYNKYLNDGGDPEDTADFFYKGSRPRTKEQTILMLCDTLEAASRTLKDNNPATFDSFVEKVVQAKADAGQLEDSEISLKELNTVKSVLKTYLARMYHDRVIYPRRKKTGRGQASGSADKGGTATNNQK